MTIYLAHSASYDFVRELYEPIQQSELSKKYTFLFPHGGKPLNSKDRLAACDLVLAEVSLPSIGLGIELGWANDLKKKIICLHRTDVQPAKSLTFVSRIFIHYQSTQELIEGLQRVLAKVAL